MGVSAAPPPFRATPGCNQAGAGDLHEGLPKPVKSLPEHIPRLLWVPAHKNVRVIPDGVVLDPVGNRKVAGQLTGRKDRLAQQTSAAGKGELLRFFDFAALR